MAYLPADIQATLAAIKGHLDALQAPLQTLRENTHSGLDRAKSDLALAYFHYVMLYLSSRLEGDDSCYALVQEGVSQVQACADLLQSALTPPVSTSN